MLADKTQSKTQIEKLVAYFEKNIHQLKAPSFNETQTRNQLIDPFFEALGWDVHNKAMKPLYLQEVVPEGRVKTTFGKEVKEQTALFETKETLGKEYKEYSSILDYIAEDEYKASSKEATKKPDYRFRIKGQTKFFLEAKKPSIDLMKSQDAIFQVKRYGFSGRVPVSILTDFEEFRVFDCTHKPLYEKPKLGIIKDFDFLYTNYLDRFDKLFDTFSRDAVEAGSLETLTTKLLQKRTGDFALDKTFLEDLSRWRIELARDIAKHPKNRRKLNDYTLNESVQRILDRIIFFRVCEDREIEVENTLLAVLRMWKDRPGISLYSLLNKLFQQRRSLYNGLLFSPHECEELEVSDKVMLEILENLNYPFSPYHFNEIGVEILGSIYEKFLGKTIHLTPKTVRVDEKPEVRKAGGVYYTPQYIVNYIVDNTVGKLLYDDLTYNPLLRGEDVRNSSSEKQASPLLLGEGQGEVSKTMSQKLKLSPKQVSKLKIIDIACGSGSFLLGAFQKLIDYHIEWYRAYPKDIQTINGVPDEYTDANGNLHISSRKKRDILVNNIYGVDIDRQAVEVTQMSLYLKVLEGENAETLNPQMTLALKEVYLPVLTDNIKCGNSLIGTDFLSQGELFDDETRRKVNPFDWEREFPEILGKRSPLLIGEGQGEVFSEKNETPPQSSPKRGGGSGGGFDVVIGNPPYGFHEIHEKAAKIYFKNHYESSQGSYEQYFLFYEKSLKLLKKDGFHGFIVPVTWLTIPSAKSLRKLILGNYFITQICWLPELVFEKAQVNTLISIIQSSKPKNVNVLVYDSLGLKDRPITQSIVSQSKFIEDDYYISIFESDIDSKILKKFLLLSKPLDEICEPKSGYNPYEVGGGQGTDGKPQSKKTVETKPYHSEKKIDKTWKPEIVGRDLARYFVNVTGKRWVKYGPWLSAPRDPNNFLGKRILVQEITGGAGKKIVAAYFDGELYHSRDVIPIKITKEIPHPYYILGIVNSTLITWFHHKRNPKAQKGLFPKVLVSDLKNLPIRTIDFTKPEEKQMHDELVALVDTMLELHKQLNKANFDSEKEPIQRQITATDEIIDQLVYKLYGLTEEEIKIVEGGA